MTGSPQKTIEMYLPSELGYEKIAMAAAAAAAKRMGFLPDRIEDLKTAVGESVANAIEHGNRLQSEVRVLVVLSVEAAALALKIIDGGFQPIPPLPTDRDIRDDNRGWGMFLIKNLVDEVEVAAHPDRNEVRMVLYLEQ